MDDSLAFGAGNAEQFLHRWYGTAGNPDAGLAATNPMIPAELAEWHAAAARTGVPVAFQDFPVPLTELSPRTDGLLPIWVENQHGFYWAVNLDDPDRRVFSRESGAEDWVPTGENLGRFLLHCTIREAIIGAAKKFTVFVSEPLLRDSMESFSVLGFPALASEEPETTIWSSADALARVAVPPVGYGAVDEQLWMVTIAVPNNASIEKYESQFGVESSGQVAPASEIPDEKPPF